MRELTPIGPGPPSVRALKPGAPMTAVLPSTATDLPKFLRSGPFTGVSFCSRSDVSPDRTSAWTDPDGSPWSLYPEASVSAVSPSTATGYPNEVVAAPSPADSFWTSVQFSARDGKWLANQGQTQAETQLQRGATFDPVAVFVCSAASGDKALPVPGFRRCAYATGQFTANSRRPGVFHDKVSLTRSLSSVE